MKSASLLTFVWLLLATVGQELSTVEPALSIIDCCHISCFNTNVNITMSELPCSGNRDLCFYEATFLLNETNFAILPSTIKNKCTKCIAGNYLKHANDIHTFSLCCDSPNCNGDEQQGEESFLSSKLQEAFKKATLKNDDDEFRRVFNAYLKSKSATTSSTSSTTTRRPLAISNAVEGSGTTKNMSADLTDSAEKNTISFNNTAKETSLSPALAPISSTRNAQRASFSGFNTSQIIKKTTSNGSTAAQSKSAPANNFSTAPVMTTSSLPSVSNNGTAASESAGGEWIAPLVGTIVCLFLGAAGVAGVFLVYRFMLRRHITANKAAADDSSVQL